MNDLSSNFYLKTFVPDTSGYCVQTWPGERSKYRRIHRPVTGEVVKAALAGKVTLAVKPLSPDGLAHAAIIDADSGGVDGLRRALDVCADLGLKAFAQVSVSQNHDGGHVWVFVDRPTPAGILRSLARIVADRAGLAEAEARPTP